MKRQWHYICGAKTQVLIFNTIVNINKTTTVCQGCNLYRLWEKPTYLTVVFLFHHMYCYYWITLEKCLTWVLTPTTQVPVREVLQESLVMKLRGWNFLLNLHTSSRCSSPFGLFKAPWSCQKFDLKLVCLLSKKILKFSNLYPCLLQIFGNISCHMLIDMLT